MAKDSLKPLLKPRYLPVWILIGILRLFAFLPYSVLVRCGKILGYLLILVPSKIKQTTEVNLKLCFPELSSTQRHDLLKKNFISVGIGIFETALAWFAPAKKLAHLGHIKGLEQVHLALSKGKGAILISPHFTTLQIAGRLLSLKQPFAVIYRRQKHPVINYVTERSLKKYYCQIIARGDLRKMLRCLSENTPVWYTPDVDAGLRNSVFAPFFGIEAATITTTARLAKRSGAPVIPAFFYRRDDFSGYDLVGESLIEDFSDDHLVEDATRVNHILEQGIRKKPEQYIWQYKRFKTRPPGEKRFY